MDLIEPARLTLLLAAASIAGVHTLVGVDHYLPFVVIGRARKWSVGKVAAITAACGLGHVVGSIVLGAVGIGLGVALGHLEWIESVRGSLAAWGLIAFGLVYMVWAWRRAREHKHVDPGAASVTLSSLFVIFALGPCEPLIPVLMAPAFEHDWWLVFEVAATFSIVTIGSMVGMAMIGTAGLQLAPLHSVERYGGVAAGAAIASSGAAIQLLGI